MKEFRKQLKRIPLMVSVLLIASCTAGREAAPSVQDTSDDRIDDLKLAGGSSGMEQVGDCSYLVVYDLKNYSNGIRLGLISVTGESLSVAPIKVHSWGADGKVNDLESICSVPGRANEFLVAEAGNWQGVFGRIFHIRVDFEGMQASVLGSVLYPQLHVNDFGVTGDQYEGMLCFPFDENRRIVVLAERGGSEVFAHGIVRWGILDLDDHTFDLSGRGMQGIEVDIPGDWSDPGTKRDITDLHIDAEGGIWGVASEDQGDAGPFYSVIYKLGETDLSNKEQPFRIFDRVAIYEDVDGFKIEALSGPCQGLKNTHTFGTEDELYGGVWRPIEVK